MNAEAICGKYPTKTDIVFQREARLLFLAGSDTRATSACPRKGGMQEGSAVPEVRAWLCGGAGLQCGVSV